MAGYETRRVRSETSSNALVAVIVGISRHYGRYGAVESGSCQFRSVQRGPAICAGRRCRGG